MKLHHLCAPFCSQVAPLTFDLQVCTPNNVIVQTFSLNNNSCDLLLAPPTLCRTILL